MEENAKIEEGQTQKKKIQGESEDGEEKETMQEANEIKGSIIVIMMCKSMIILNVKMKMAGKQS